MIWLDLLAWSHLRSFLLLLTLRLRNAKSLKTNPSLAKKGACVGNGILLLLLRNIKKVLL